MKRKTFSDKIQSEMISLYKSGKTTREIAPLYDCAWPVVLRLLKDNGVRTKGRPLSESERQDIIQSYKAGERTSSIVARYRISTTKVVALLRESGTPVRIATTGMTFGKPNLDPRPCKRCGIVKPVTGFTKSETKSGYGAHCLCCEADRCRRKAYLKHFGITIKEYDDLLSSQGGVCAICQSTSGRVNALKRLAVDHCHATGLVRGLLCENCNRALGLFKDSHERLLAAAKYLQS